MRTPTRITTIVSAGVIAAAGTAAVASAANQGSPTCDGTGQRSGQQAGQGPGMHGQGMRAQQHSAQLIGQGHRRVAGGVGASRDAAVDLAECNLVAELDCRFEAGATGACQVIGWRFRRQRRAEYAFACQVPVT